MLSVMLDDTRDPARNLALDEALVRAAAFPRRPAHDPARPPLGPQSLLGCPAPRAARPGAFPVLRVWQCTPCVVVGRFQDVGTAVDLAACAHDGVEVVRRASGGEAVHLDAGTLAFTLVQRPEAPGTGRCGADAGRPAGTRGRHRALDVLVATAIEGLGVPAAVLRDGVVQVARLRTKSAHLVHVAVHVQTVRPDGRYLAGGGGPARTPALTDLGAGMTPDAVRAAVLGTVVDEFGLARTRRPDAGERAVRDHLHAVRYGDLAWHLTGGRRAAGKVDGRRPRVRR